MIKSQPPTKENLSGTVASRRLLFVTLLAASLAAGCRLGQPSSASFASVLIHNHTVPEIQQATVAVFQEDGYRALRSPEGALVLEKEGSRMSDIAYSGLAGAHYGETTKVRVWTEIVDMGAGSHRLQCKVYMVRNAGDSFFEEQQPLAHVRRGPYQSLLNKVAERLK